MFIRENTCLPLQVSSSNHPIPYCVSGGSDCKFYRSQREAPEWTPPRSMRWSSGHRQWLPPMMEGAIPFEIINDSAERGLSRWIYVNKNWETTKRRRTWSQRPRSIDKYPSLWTPALYPRRPSPVVFPCHRKQQEGVFTDWKKAWAEYYPQEVKKPRGQKAKKRGDWAITSCGVALWQDCLTWACKRVERQNKIH